jgi:hypothetical protein
MAPRRSSLGYVRSSLKHRSEKRRMRVLGVDDHRRLAEALVMVPRGEGLSNVAFDRRDVSIVRPWRYDVVILEPASLRPVAAGTA